MRRLEAAGIPYSYFDRPSHEVVNELYQTLDLYPVSSRHEGGPQSLIECGLLDVHSISRDVGMSSQVLPPSSISNDLSLAIPMIPEVFELKLPQGYNRYRELIKSL